MTSFVQKALTALAFSLPLAASVATAQNATSDSWSPYIEASELSALMEATPNLQVIDIRSEKHIADGVLPGAIWIPFDTWRGTEDRPSQPPTEEEFEALLGAHGVRIEDPIIVHHRAGKTIQTGRAAIVYWLLKSAGADEVAILDGGYKGWTEADLPTQDAPSVANSHVVDITFETEWWADAFDIFAVTSGQVNGAILDARLDSQVRKSVETGKPMMSMPMAQYVPASLFTNPMSSRRLTAEAQQSFVADLADRGIGEETEFLISVCQTGELSALSWFYASEIVGMENVRYYPDALRGWKADGGVMFGMRTD